MKEPKTTARDDEEGVPFDDCLRLLVNTPPKPNKTEDKPSPDEEEKESEK